MWFFIALVVVIAAVAVFMWRRGATGSIDASTPQGAALDADRPAPHWGNASN